jgi:leucyl aminopeptidase
MAKKSTSLNHNVIVVDGLKSLASLNVTKEEMQLLKSEIKKNGDFFEVNDLNLLTFYVFVGKKLDAKEKEKIRQVGAKITARLNAVKGENVIVSAVSQNDNALLLVEGMALSNYQFLKYFTDKKKKENSLKNIFVKEDNISSKKSEELWTVIESTHICRDLVNEPLSYLNATTLSDELIQLGEEAGFSVEVLDQLKIESLKMGGLLAVNKGSIDPCTFNILEYKPKKASNSKPLVLVGKGVVYDTGGLSLKPTPNSMDIMKCDMGGAATVACAIHAIAKAKLNVHVVGLIPATDNRPGGNAYAPGDVIKMYDGTTVEVMNTDAEGRMILADALTYAKKYKPELVIDFATLTGSAVRAIGTYASVMMGTASDDVFEELSESGYETYERLVQFPFYDEYAEEIKSPIADLKNIGGAEGGAITAGKFLEHFTDYPWVHVDIAGPAWANASKGYITKGGTGVGVRMLFDFVKNNY